MFIVEIKDKIFKQLFFSGLVSFVSLFKGITTLVGYLMPKSFSKKNSTINPYYLTGTI